MIFFEQKSIKFRLAFYLISLTTLILIATYFLTSLASRYVVLESVEENAFNLTNNQVNKLEQFLNPIERVPEVIATLIEEDATTPEGLERTVSSLLMSYPDIYGVCIAYEPESDSQRSAPYFYRSNDLIEIADLGSDSYKYEFWDWFQIPRTLGKNIWSEPYFDDGGGNQNMITYSVPFYKHINNKKVFAGIVTADVTLSVLQNLISETKFFESGYLFSITQFGTFVNHKYEELLLNETIFTLAEEIEMNEWRTLGREMIEGKTGYTSITDPFTNNKAYVFYENVPSTHWSLAIIIPEDELLSQATVVSNYILIIEIAALIAIIIIVLFTSSNITEPITKLSKIANLFSLGKVDEAMSNMAELENLRNKIGRNYIRSGENTTDEITTLFNSIKNMTLNLFNMTVRIQTSSEDLITTSDKLDKSINSLSEAVSIQNTSTSEVTATTKEIAGTVDKLAVTIKKVTQNLAESQETVDSGKAGINEIILSLNSIADNGKSISGQLNVINRKANNITKIINTITNIADRTNLISVNAAIEAEKAGVYASGFTVLAKEIRILSESTFEALADIEGLIDEMKSSVETGVEGVKIFNEMMNSTFANVNLLLLNLNRLIVYNQNMLPEFDKVNESMQQQAESAKQISGAMVYLQSVSQNTGSALDTLIEIHDKLTSAVDELKNEISKLYS
ncbi:MAG: methyl-accepting chemotaxis protein [Ignavibacteriaceae bacterium]|nr:methyl-accepting chemotaxis protein [Ignavibacteriaceae bacterium]